MARTGAVALAGVGNYYVLLGLGYYHATPCYFQLPVDPKVGLPRASERDFLGPRAPARNEREARK